MGKGPTVSTVPPSYFRLEAAVAGGPVSTANMKKESKAYSYEDQKWEVEMRQEIMRKRRAEAGQSTTATARELIKKAKLSEKQRVSEDIGTPHHTLPLCHLILLPLVQLILCY